MTIIGVDTGGTFTDFIIVKDGSIEVFKTLSTPEDPSKAVLKGLRLFPDKERKIIHGSTVATNAILERKGAKTAYLTNKGFEDIIEIGRQNRRELYNLHYKRVPPLVPSDLRFGLDCRVLHDGTVFKDLDSFQVYELFEYLKSAGVESVAVCFLFSYVNPIHEEIILDISKEFDIPVSISSKLVKEFREYERASTTILNAYVLPVMKRYIEHIEDGIYKKDLFLIMQSNGGVISSETAKREPVRTVLSGPAGGVFGAYWIGRLAGFSNIITFDMGGTSTDVSLIDGEPSYSYDSYISDFPIKVPIIDIHTVGAGGGSIAYVDDGGALRVGPESAGAFPGPICYGKGDRITVTDANLFFNRLVPEYFLGGNMKIYPERLHKYFEEMAKELNLDVYELAQGILDVANSNMEKAIRVISIDRGYDPKDFVLLSFGGAGGMHAAFLAEILGMNKVLIPVNPGALSAFGMVVADMVKDYSKTILVDGDNISFDELVNLFEKMKSRAIEELINIEKHKGDYSVFLYLDMRYKGQSYEITIPFVRDYISSFHDAHNRLYGYSNKNMETEIVNLRLKIVGKTDKPEIPRIERGDERILGKAIVGEENVFFYGKQYKTRIIDRSFLLSGNILFGPSIVVEYTSTTVIPPNWKGVVDDYGNIVLEKL